MNKCTTHCSNNTVKKLIFLALFQGLNHIFWLDIGCREKLPVYILLQHIKINIVHERMNRSLLRGHRWKATIYGFNLSP
jgi:hypothetical protein